MLASRLVVMHLVHSHPNCHDSTVSLRESRIVTKLHMPVPDCYTGIWVQVLPCPPPWVVSSMIPTTFFYHWECTIHVTDEENTEEPEHFQKCTFITFSIRKGTEKGWVQEN